MKIIDLLNKIANGEEPPNKIKYEGKEYIYQDQPRNYQCLSEPYEMLKICDGWDLNNEVEILGGNND